MNFSPILMDKLLVIIDRCWTVFYILYLKLSWKHSLMSASQSKGSCPPQNIQKVSSNKSNNFPAKIHSGCSCTMAEPLLRKEEMELRADSTKQHVTGIWEDGCGPL